MKDEWRVGRVIARPYIGMKKGEFKRTSNRRDYALKPPAPTVLNALKDAGNDVIGVGKIHDIFCGEGITKTYHSESSVHGMEQTIDVCKEEFTAKAGMNPKTLQYLMGHSDIGVTMNTYTHLSLDDAKNEMIRMEELEQARKEVDKAEDKKPMKQNMFKVV